MLMISSSLYGFVQPFQHLAVNILETVLSINTLILLFLRNIDTIEEDLGSLSQQPEHASTCQDKVEGLTAFTLLLLPLYYLPLMIGCTVGGVWIAFEVRWVVIQSFSMCNIVCSNYRSSNSALILSVFNQKLLYYYCRYYYKKRKQLAEETTTVVIPTVTQAHTTAELYLDSEEVNMVAYRLNLT